MDTKQIDHEKKLSSMMWGHYISASLLTIVELKVADYLKGELKSADELAGKIGCNAKCLYRLMRALATVGIFEMHENKFSLSPMGSLLRSDAPRSHRGKVTEICGYLKEWSELTDSVINGRPVKEDIFDYLLSKDQSAEHFYEAMDSYYYDAPAPMLGKYDFSGAKTVADIGCGSGGQLTEILKHYPDMKGIMFDRPEAAKMISKKIKDTEIADRCQVVGGSFFDAVPAGADIYILRHVIHNWNDSKSIKILSNVSKVLPKDGKVLVVEVPIPSSDIKPIEDWHNVSFDDEAFVAWWDISMFISDDGAERTKEDYEFLFEKSGLKLNRIIKVYFDVCVIEAVKK